MIVARSFAMQRYAMRIVKIAAACLIASFAALVGLKISLAVGPEAAFSGPVISSSGLEDEVTLAFVGDHGAGPETFKVFELIKRQGTDLLVSQGDFGYDKTADEFEAVLDATLGSDFPIVAALGNHDWPEQLRYMALFAERLERTPEVKCWGDILMRSTCSFRGIDIISATPGITATDWLDNGTGFIRRALRSSKARWTICNWHKNQTALQLGGKGNDVGWAAYDACREHGALIVNAHEHSYSRTLPIIEMQDQPDFTTGETGVAELRPGQTIVIVSGLGGRSVRKQRRTAPWFAASYTSDQNAKPGALFCTFKLGGASEEAQCRFVNIDDEIVDRFRITTGEQYGS